MSRRIVAGRIIAGSAVWGRLLGTMLLVVGWGELCSAQSGRGAAGDSSDRRGGASAISESRFSGGSFSPAATFDPRRVTSESSAVQRPIYFPSRPQNGSVNSGNTGVVWYRPDALPSRPWPPRQKYSLPAVNVYSVYYLQGDDSYYLQTDSGLFGPYAAPPVEMPAEVLFGPQAVQRFMGVAPQGGAMAGAQPQIAALPLPQQPPAGGAAPQGGQAAGGPFPPVAQMNAPAAPKPNVRPSTAAGRERAWKQIDLGDAQFGKRQFSSALQHYRDAAAAANDLGEAFFRQAQAEVALGMHTDAVAAIRRGLLFDPDWADSDFRLDQLYGDNRPVKLGRLSDVTKAADAHLHDAAAQFLAGVELYFDDQLQRAALYLRRAATLYGPQAGASLQGFLKHLPPEKPAAAPNNPQPLGKPVAAAQGLDI